MSDDSCLFATITIDFHIPCLLQPCGIFKGWRSQGLLHFCSAVGWAVLCCGSSTPESEG